MSKGRPKDPKLQEQTRKALLDSLRSLLSEKPYKQISIRDIATKAGTQSPMISYYFGSKFGLIEALIQQKATERKDYLNVLVSKCLEEPEKAIDTLVDGIIEMLYSEVWLFRMIQDETINDSEELKNLLVQEFSTLGSNAIGVLISRLQELKLIKQEIDFQFFMVLFISVMIAPITNSFLLSTMAGFDESHSRGARWKNYASQQLKCALGIEG